MDEDEDHYKVLGVSKDATKQEIKAAFRKLAMKFHPDKHSPDSPKSIRDVSNHKFRQISQAYDLLIDDRKRADYNHRRTRNHHPSNGYGYGYGYGYGNGYGYGGKGNSSRYSYSYKPPRPPGGHDGFVSRFELALRFLTTRAFLLNLSFAGALLGGLVVIDIGRESLWKRHNSGKSFEEAMESIEKTKADKDKM